MKAYQANRRMLPSRFLSLGRGGSNLVVASSQGILNDQYAAGRWDYLAGREEMPRYAVIAGYCAYRGEAAGVLDLGCGTGILRRWLRPDDAVGYVGVDMSDIAIERARQEANGAGTFAAMDIATYTPDRTFEFIVFNEVLYYFSEPGDILLRYAGFLKDDGCFVISLWESAEGQRAWLRASDSVSVIDAVHVSNNANVAWRIRLCRPRLVSP